MAAAVRMGGCMREGLSERAGSGKLAAALGVCVWGAGGNGSKVE